MAGRLHLLIPGLLGPWPGAAEPGFPLPEAPALGRLLGRAEALAGQEGLDPTLFRLFGLDPADAPPVAAVTRLADRGDPGAGWWLRADPVHLAADLHQVVLLEAHHLAVTAAEAEALAGDFNRHFQAEGLHLETPHPERWYLRLDHDPGIHTHPLERAAGRDVHPLLPQGPQARRWRSLLTETQMLFHAAAVNQARQDRGLPPINSVWLWGGGALPERAATPVEGVYAADPLARGLARLAGQAVSPVPADAAAWRAAAAGEAGSLVVLEAVRHTVADGAPDLWAARVNALERDWFAPLIRGLRQDHPETLWLHPCRGRVYRLGRRELRRFWRRSRPLPEYLP